MLDVQELQDRFRGALLGGAIGDALGAQVERGGVDPGDGMSLDGATEQLTHSDSTELTLAVAESLVQRHGFSGPDLATNFVHHYLASPGREYSQGLHDVLQLLHRGVLWDTAGYRLVRGTGPRI